jgi:hypothetical protein
MGTSEVTAPPPPQPAAPATDAAKGKNQPAPDAAAEQAAETPEGAAGAEGAETPPAGADETGDAVEAKVGAGAKGRDYGGEGFVTTPIEALFRADDLIVFEAHIPKNMELYKAEHDNKGPQTHEEFMQVIIKDGGVKLPELPEGEEYWYDAKTEKLMVRHPKPAKP